MKSEQCHPILIANDPISFTNLLHSSNSNSNPFVDHGLLLGTYIFYGLNTSKEGCVSTFFVYSLVTCRPSYVYCCCCCYYCWKCCGLVVFSIQFSYTSSSKCKCSLPFGNLVSCSLLTSWLYSLNFLSCGDVIYGSSCLCSLNCPSC